MSVSKQDIIREEIGEHLTELFEQTEGIKEPAKLVEAVLWVLNEDGVVKKVDRKLPDKMFLGGYGYIQGHQLGVLLDKLNLVAVESLI